MQRKTGPRGLRVDTARASLLMAVLVASPFVLFAGHALADRLVLDNGDILTGTVVKLEGGKLTLETDYAGAVEVAAGRITAIVTDQPVEVHTASGEILKGKLTVVESGKVAVEPSPEREATAVDWQKVAAINPTPQGVWTGSVTVGGNHQSGNTDRASASLPRSRVRDRSST